MYSNQTFGQIMPKYKELVKCRYEERFTIINRVEEQGGNTMVYCFKESVINTYGSK